VKAFEEFINRPTYAGANMGHPDQFGYDLSFSAASKAALSAIVYVPAKVP